MKAAFTPSRLVSARSMAFSARIAASFARSACAMPRSAASFSTVVALAKRRAATRAARPIACISAAGSLVECRASARLMAKGFARRVGPAQQRERIAREWRRVGKAKRAHAVHLFGPSNAWARFALPTLRDHLHDRPPPRHAPYHRAEHP